MADGADAMGHSQVMIPVPTTSLRKTSKMTGRYKKTQPNNLFLLCSHFKRRKPHAPAGCLAGLASPPVAGTEPVCAPATSLQSS